MRCTHRQTDRHRDRQTQHTHAVNIPAQHKYSDVIVDLPLIKAETATQRKPCSLLSVPRSWLRHAVRIPYEASIMPRPCLDQTIRKLRSNLDETAVILWAQRMTCEYHNHTYDHYDAPRSSPGLSHASPLPAQTAVLVALQLAAMQHGSSG